MSNINAPEHGLGVDPKTVPHAHLGYEPDHQPMKALTVVIVIVALNVIGTGFGVASLLDVMTREQKAESASKVVDARLASTRAAADERLGG